MKGESLYQTKLQDLKTNLFKDCKKIVGTEPIYKGNTEKIYNILAKKLYLDTNNNEPIKQTDTREDTIVDATATRVFGTDPDFKREIVWKNVFGFLLLHVAALYGCYMIVSTARWLTNFWMVLLIFLGGEGVTIGAHRLWTHRSFKASRSLSVILLALQTLAGQNCLWVWVRDHRQHHKYSDTDADPHNANRGFFFSHIGWLMSRKHPLVIEMGKGIDMSDIEADSLLMIQKKYYKTLYIIFAMIIPVYVPVYLWGESAMVSFYISYFVRYILQLHATWAVNSIAHLYGTRPYDKNLMPVESLFVSVISNGEGWHNYHHAFPWDYKAAEFGTNFQLTSKLIRKFEQWGLVSDLKEASPKMVNGRVKRTGDGTHQGHLAE